MNLTYTLYDPPPHLSDIVERVWFFGTDGSEQECSCWKSCPSIGAIELILLYQGPNTLTYVSGEVISYPRAYFTGVSETPIQWAQAGNSRMMGLRLRPEGLLRILPDPPSTFMNTHLDAELVFGTSVRLLLEQLAWARNHAEAIAFAEVFLLNFIQLVEGQRQRVIRALSAIRHNPTLGSGAWADQANMCERQMQRLVKDYLGIRPGFYARMLRFGRVIEQARKEEAAWSHLALDGGYSDQAHLIRDFKAFAGLPPLAFSKQQGWYLSGYQQEFIDCQK